MKKNPSAVIMIIVNAAAIFWLIYLATFSSAVKYFRDDSGISSQYRVTPYEHLVFPILALLLSSFFLIRNMLSKRNKPIPEFDPETFDRGEVFGYQIF